jgi:YD repeat-containing protein
MRDPNGLVVKRRVDGFGRMVEEHRPDGVVTTQTITRAKDGGPAGDWWATHIARATPGHGESEVVLDGNGRAVRERVMGPEGWLEKEREFDVKGRLTFESNLHTAGDQVAAATGAKYRYDGAERLAEVTSPWGAKTTYTHDKEWVYVVEPGTADVLPTTTATRLDPLGRPVEVRDAKNESSFYSYGPFGEALSVTGPDDNSTSWTRDAYGRVTLSVEPDRGITTTDYTGFDEPWKILDAAGRYYELRYDRLGRLIERKQGGGVTTYEFDTAPHGIGLLARSTSPEGHVREYDYDWLSRPAGSTLTFGDGQVFAGSSIYL